MSKQWKPGKETVPLRPSRIRRDPVRLDRLDKVEAKPRSREREMWAAVAGVAVIAAGCAALVVGLSQVTSFGGAEAVEESAGPRFGHCRSGGGSDCVLDGDTIFIAGRRVDIAGIDAPEVYGSRCPEEGRRGIQAAVRLRDLLNGGTVTVTGIVRGAGGRVSHKVEVGGRDVGTAMIAAEVARGYGDGPRPWC